MALARQGLDRGCGSRFEKVKFGFSKGQGMVISSGLDPFKVEKPSLKQGNGGWL